MPYVERIDKNGKTEKKDRYYTPGRKKKAAGLRRLFGAVIPRHCSGNRRKKV